MRTEPFVVQPTHDEEGGDRQPYEHQVLETERRPLEFRVGGDAGGCGLDHEQAEGQQGQYADGENVLESEPVDGCVHGEFIGPVAVGA